MVKTKQICWNSFNYVLVISRKRLVELRSCFIFNLITYAKLIKSALMKLQKYWCEFILFVQVTAYDSHIVELSQSVGLVCLSSVHS